MSASDEHADAVVVSVVYDGPPEAGKTTSVRSLARSLGREVYTPEERDGRTVFFDWLEHVGGRFEGAPIRCQIASVPGQARWTRRRGHFLDRADVVVFVGDTAGAGWPTTVARLDDLRAGLARRAGAPVGIVFQANKRDRSDAVPLAEVRARVGSERIAVIESIAPDGSGVREAFVFAVRLALDRVRAERARGDAAPGRSGLGSGDTLYDLLRALDPEPAAARVEEVAAAAPAAPRLPAPDLASALIWPPVLGRIVLREAVLHGGAARITASGDCVAGLGSAWRLHSAAGAAYATIDDGRAALIAWARRHAAADALLSRPRCLALAETGDGRWRLWQIVRREPSLRELVAEAGGLAIAQRLVAEAAAACAAAGLDLPCTLDTIGEAAPAQPIYVGLVPR